MSKRDFLLEIGTEELPPKSLFTLARALAEGIVAGLDGASLAHGEARWFATPRRLAVRVPAVADRQPDQQIRRQGPAVASAFDASGQPTRAGLGFAASCGVAIEQLQRAEGPKGPVLLYVGTRRGEPATALLPRIVDAAIQGLPIARRMRWGAGEQEFVRPVHWIVMLFGSSVVEGTILGLPAGRHTYGHRFHAPGRIALPSPGKYEQLLLDKGRVLVDAAARRERIRAGVAALAESIGGQAVIEEALLEEVTALVEWPVPIAGRFDARYLELPPEVPIATMQEHQRYFPVRDAAGRLLNAFITVANIESRDPDKVRDGNERVVRPRLADAAFFWDSDRRERLEQRRPLLKNVTFQAKLGSLYDKSERMKALAERIAAALGSEPALAARAAELSKCDLLSAMVGEFPELQGTMGKHYAENDGEPPEVCAALEQQYWPRYSGDRIPEAATGIALSIADKLDTIAGIYSIGQKPSGTRDPFGLRRAAVGILRTLLEHRLDLDLRQMVDTAVALQPVHAPEGTAEEIWDYLMERLRSAYLDEAPSSGITTEMFDAVLAAKPHSPLDMDVRLRALQAFLSLPQAASLASANKRIANILRKAAHEMAEAGSPSTSAEPASEPSFPTASPEASPAAQAPPATSAAHSPGESGTWSALSGAVDTALLQEPAERQLFEHVVSMERAVNPLFARREYTQALTQLATLREDVDRFFDSVMVMAEDAQLRANRLGLLVRLRGLFLQVADLSRLPG